LTYFASPSPLLSLSNSAPAIGGFLSQPAEKYPHIFGGTFVETYPYILPCLVSGSIGLFGFIIGAIHLKETVVRKSKK
jgi:hypothetical protein